VSIATGYNFSATVLNTYGSGVITEFGSKVYFGDFNGDRKSDLLVYKPLSQVWNICYGTGKGLVSVPFSFKHTLVLDDNNDHIIVADFNGDGKSDILDSYTLHSSPFGTNLDTYYSTGYNTSFPSSSFYYEQYHYIHEGIRLTAGDFNGDGRSDVLYDTEGGLEGFILYFKPMGEERFLVSVTNGFDHTTSFEYKLLTEAPSFYNRTVSLDDAANAYPNNYVRLPLYAVSKITVPNGIGGNVNTTFTYKDAILNRAGKGFLGFKNIISDNHTTDIITETQNTLNTQYALLYPVKTKTYFEVTNENLSETQITTTFIDRGTGSPFDKRFLQHIDKTLNIDYVNSRASESNNTYDNYGNITTNVTKTGILSGSTVTATETVTTTTVFGTHNTPVPAKPDNITVSNIRSGAASVSKKTDFTYTASGLIQTQKEFPGLAKAVTTTYGYDAYGNTTKIDVAATGLTTRTSTFTYDTKGRFPTGKKLASGSAIEQSETYQYHVSWCKPTSITSGDCQTTTFEYDEFGRLKKTNLPEGYSITTTYNWDVSNDNVYYTLTSAPGNPDEKKWYDILGRETQTQTEGFNGQWLTQNTTYYPDGNVNTKTNSYYSGETPLTTKYLYDQYNRVTSESNALQTLTYAYTKLSNGQVKVTVTNLAGQNSSKTTDAAGKIINSIDNGGQLDFTYDSWGNQKTVKHGSNVLVNNVYDSYGRQTTLTDKNAGTVTYTYDAFGQLTNQTDANGNAYTMQYDVLGRIISRQGPEGTTTYAYFANGACRNNNLSKVTGFNGVIKDYTYDTYQRLKTEKLTTDDGSVFTTTYAYNTYGDLIQTTYPSGLVVKNVYDANGIQTSVNAGNGTTQTTLFTATAMNGFGQCTGYKLGNNLTSTNTYNFGLPQRFTTKDANGIVAVQDLKFTFDDVSLNLTQRKDFIKGKAENFQYDNLNRLVSSQIGAQTPTTVSYDGTGSFSMGNITSKTDAGNYTYFTDKIHAVSYILNPAGAQTPPDNISTETQTISYTPFLKVNQITEGTSPVNTVTYTYGPDYQRVKSVFKVNNGVKDTKYYFGNYEKQTTTTGTREIHYISGANGLCAIVVKENGVYNYYFTYTDYLGSILTVTDITGAVVAEQNFDAWGRFRNPSTWKYTQIPTQPEWLYRGYTGHEHIKGVNLINMNGRVYDPITGRMLSPDNYVSDPFGTQGYNRYGYAMNNPLSYADPDGNNPLLLLALISGWLGGAQSKANGDGFFDGFWKGTLVGLVGGAAGNLLSGAFSSFGLVGSGMLTGTITGFVSGGLNSMLNGGDVLNDGIKGGLLGGVIGASVGIFERLTLPSSDFQISQSAEYNGDYFRSQEELDDFINKNIGDVDKIKSTLHTQFSLASETNLPPGYFYQDNFMYNASNGNLVGGNTTALKGGWFSPLKSNIIFSPGAKGYFYNGKNATQMIIDHEFVHSYHFLKGLLNPRYSESAASAYSLLYAKTYGMTSAYNIYRSAIIDYPGAYSWRNVLKLGILNMGIR